VRLSFLQARVFIPPPEHCRRLIVATNIAETSITVDGVVYVVDSGMVKLKTYNPATGIESLNVTPISRCASKAEVCCCRGEHVGCAHLDMVEIGPLNAYQCHRLRVCRRNENGVGVNAALKSRIDQTIMC
jgi:hypothetical protein